MNILIQILIVFLYAAISLGIYYGFRKYVLKKYSIKKLYVIIAMVVVILFPFFATLVVKVILPSWVFTFQMILFTVIFLIYLEVLKIDKAKKNKPVIGKPKAKPNKINSQK